MEMRLWKWSEISCPVLSVGQPLALIIMHESIAPSRRLSTASLGNNALLSSSLGLTLPPPTNTPPPFGKVRSKSENLVRQLPENACWSCPNATIKSKDGANFENFMNASLDPIFCVKWFYSVSALSLELPRKCADKKCNNIIKRITKRSRPNVL